MIFFSLSPSQGVWDSLGISLFLVLNPIKLVLGFPNLNEEVVNRGWGKSRSTVIDTLFLAIMSNGNWGT